jgi:hypothetical protein
MKKFALIAVAISLTGCATTGTEMQAECEAKYREFPDIFQCTYDAVAARNPKILQDSRAKLYLLRGEQLALAVVKQKMTSLDAKVEWQKLYVELKAAKKQEISTTMLAVSQSLTASRVTQPQTATNPSINCTSTKLGTTVYTDCH